MKRLSLNTTQLTYLKKAVHKLRKPYEDLPAELSMENTDISEAEKDDLRRKLEALTPTKPAV